MIDARHRWVIPDPIRLDPAYRAAARELGLGSFAAAILARRGIGDIAGLTAFLGPARDGLNDPRLLPDADPAWWTGSAWPASGREGHGLRRLRRGRADGARPAGPGVPAPGPEVLPYVPSRLDEGHGLSMAAVGTAAEGGQSLIVTVDTGSTSVAEVAAAAERGIDVVITDHHHLPDVLPAAVALVNPHRADSGYPDPELSGSGVAFTVARLLLGSYWRGGGGPPAGGPRHDRHRLGRGSRSSARTASIARLGSS